MPGVFTLLILSVIGTLEARQPDIDINRIKRLPEEHSRFRTPTYHRRRSILAHQYNSENDYDHHSGRVTKLRAPLHLLHGTPSSTEAQAGTIHQPRQDPRAFYQSDAYIKETNRQNIDNEVSSVYVERGEVQASEHNYRPVPIRFNELNSIGEDLCIRCPYDRMLVAKPGRDRALLLQPQLKTCGGRRAPRGTHFIHMYGPKFGSLIAEGSHMVVGRVSHKGLILQTCKMQIHVLIQTCSVPKYLVSHCGNQNRTCRFTCRNPRHDILGPKLLTCGEDMTWSEELPVCRVRRWCAPPPPPEHGSLTCHCHSPDEPCQSRLAEGTRCSVKCENGWHGSLRADAYSKCRRGVWTRELKCQQIPFYKKS